jgi:hypothetical protein
VFLVDKPEQTNVGITHRCRQAKHVTWIVVVVDMVMGVVVGVHFSF